MSSHKNSDPFDLDDETIRRVSERWFSVGREYSEEFKAGFVYAMKSGFVMSAHFKKRPYPEPSAQADAWWAGHGSACAWLLCRAHDNEEYWNWRVYRSLRNMAPKLDESITMPHMFPYQLREDTREGDTISLDDALMGSEDDSRLISKFKARRRSAGSMDE